jgi:hypothetical protein
MYRKMELHEGNSDCMRMVLSLRAFVSGGGGGVFLNGKPYLRRMI